VPFQYPIRWVIPSDRVPYENRAAERCDTLGQMLVIATRTLERQDASHLALARGEETNLIDRRTAVVRRKRVGIDLPIDGVIVHETDPATDFYLYLLGTDARGGHCDRRNARGWSRGSIATTVRRQPSRKLRNERLYSTEDLRRLSRPRCLI